MRNVAYRIVPDPAKNTISYSKNYRIFSAEEPLPGATKILAFSEQVDMGAGIDMYLSRKFRYSFDRGNWSLWYDLNPSALGNITDLEFGGNDVFFEIRYIYDNLTNSTLATPITVSMVKFTVTSTTDGESYFSPTIYCSAEKCPAIVAEPDPTFKPYAVDTAIGIARELSFQTNQIFGHEVVYFKTEPDRDGGDFIFKEWTLFKTTARKCVKIMVPNNVFPDNKPNFNEFGVDFEVPFEVHIDHTYFEAIFGPGTQPRKRDYLYLPITNRMYEIQGSYLYRGFMMEPIYWKIQLTKFQPNSDMQMTPENREVLDNMILTTDELFGIQATEQKEDAVNKKQYKTISTRFDETRQAMHPDLTTKILDYTYNYSPLIEYYYDMSGVQPAIENYELVSTGTPIDQYLNATAPASVYAYEDSGLYSAWRNKSLNTGDSVVISNNSTIPIKMNGPKESHTHLGKYVVIEGYKNLSLQSTERRELFENPAGFLKMKQSEHSIIYRSSASTVNTPNMTFCALVKFPKGSQTFRLFDGYDSYLDKGLIISGSLTDSSGSLSTVIYVSINGTIYPFTVGTLAYDSWYALIIPISSQYSQAEVNVYSFIQDPSNVKNFNGLTKVYSNSMSVAAFDFDSEQRWSIHGANYSITNIRLFRTMVQAEDHEFIISQLFIRDESTLEIIDNARPRLNVPFISINK
jgi:hypothetical protein